MTKPIDPWRPRPLTLEQQNDLLDMLPRTQERIVYPVSEDETGAVHPSASRFRDAMRDATIPEIEIVRLELASALHFGTANKPSLTQIKADRKPIFRFREAMQEGLNAFDSLSPRDLRHLSQERPGEFYHYATITESVPPDPDALRLQMWLALNFAEERLVTFDRASEPRPYTEQRYGQAGRPENLIQHHVAKMLARIWIRLGGYIGSTMETNPHSGVRAKDWGFLDFVNAVGKTVEKKFSGHKACKRVLQDYIETGQKSDRISEDKEEKRYRLAQKVTPDSHRKAEEFSDESSEEGIRVALAEALNVGPSDIQEMLDGGISVIEIMASVLLLPLESPSDEGTHQRP